MNEKELRERLSEIHKTAVRIDNAQQVIRRDKIAKKAQSKRQATINAFKDDPETTFEEVISKGKTLERARLFLQDLDMRQSYKMKVLTDEQTQRLRDSFRTSKQQQIVNEIGGVYNGIRNYTNNFLLLTRKMWQTAVGEIVILCQQWEDADILARTLTDIYYAKVKGANKFMDAYYGISKKRRNEVEDASDNTSEEKELMQFANRFWSDSLIAQGITPKVTQCNTDGTPKTYKIVADVYGKSGLYARIQIKESICKELLQHLKGAVEVLSDFVFSKISLLTGGEAYPYDIAMPKLAEVILDSPDYVSFSSREYMDNSDKYFEKYLQKRREAGEDITEEDEKRAVIPDYNKVEASEIHINSAKIHLKQYLPDYYEG